jgi:hypothetical protein
MTVFLSQGSISKGAQYIAVMFGGNGNLADSAAAYMLKYYIVIILIAVYASTDLFRNTAARIKNSRFSGVLTVLTPVSSAVLLILCTALMSFIG